MAREISAFGVDITGYATLAGVALLTQLFIGGRDFLGFGHVYTIAIALLLVSLTALRGMSAARLVRRRGIAGTAVAGPRIPRRTDIVLSFGRPFRVSELPPELRADRQVTADAIMLRVAEQLPPPMRGVYSHGMPGATT